MINKSVLLRTLRIEPKETKIVFFTVLFAFCMGLTSNIVASIPLAMFLAHYKSSLIPYIYIFAGIVMFFAGLFISYLERIAKIFYVLTIPIAVFSGSLFLFWVLLLVLKHPFIFMALQTWSLLLVAFGTSFLFLVPNQLFTLQQSKRLFGLIYAGKAIGGAVVGFSMDFLIQTLGANHLILVAALFFLGALITQFFIKAHSGTRLMEPKKKEENKDSLPSIKKLHKYKHISYVFGLTILVYLIHYSFELFLNTSVQRYFLDENKMAVFFGILYAVCDIASVLIGLFVFRWMLLKWGLNASLLFWPITLAILLSLTFFTSVIPPLTFALFPLIVIAGVFEFPVLEGVIMGSVLLLFQPLRPSLRTWAQVRNESIVAPFALSFAGCILVWFDKYLGIRVPIMSSLIIGLCLTAALLIVLGIKKEYLRTLIESLSKRLIINPHFTILDKDNLGLLKKYLKSSYPEKVIYALETIEKIDEYQLRDSLRDALQNPSKEVICFSLRKIEKYRLKSLESEVRQICESQKDPEILGCALKAMGAISNWEHSDFFQKYLHHPDVEVVGSGLTTLLQYGSESGRKEAKKLLTKKANSPKQEDKLVAALVLQSVDIATKSNLLLPLLKDENPEVKLAASKAASSGVDEKNFPALVENLDISYTHDAALNSLVNLGRPVTEYITQNFTQFLPTTQINLIHLLGFTKEPKALEFLLHILDRADRRTLRPILLSLKRRSYHATESGREVVKSFLTSENNHILHLKEIVKQLNHEKTKLVRDLLFREIEISQECCFLLLSFIYPEAPIMDAKWGLSADNEDLNSNAVEVLLHNLSNEDQKQLMEQLNFFPYKMEEKKDLDLQKLGELFKKITNEIAVPGFSAAVVFTIGSLKLTNLTAFLRDYESSKDPLMQETLSWTLKRLSLA